MYDVDISRDVDVDMKWRYERCRCDGSTWYIGRWMYDAYISMTYLHHVSTSGRYIYIMITVSMCHRTWIYLHLSTYVHAYHPWSQSRCVITHIYISHISTYVHTMCDDTSRLWSCVCDHTSRRTYPRHVDISFTYIYQKIERLQKRVLQKSLLLSFDYQEIADDRFQKRDFRKEIPEERFQQIFFFM